MTPGGSLVPGIVPLAEDVPSHPSEAHDTLLDMSIPPGTAPGDDAVITGLTEPGTLDAICMQQETIVVE